MTSFFKVTFLLVSIVLAIINADNSNVKNTIDNRHPEIKDGEGTQVSL